MSSNGSHSEVVLQLAEEFLERHRAGERPPLQEYIEQHPDLADEIREVFPAMAMMENVALGDESLAVDAPVEPGEGSGHLGLETLGDYRIIREAGRGGMGIVYEAEQISLGRHVALKVLPRQMLLDPKQKVRFEREAKAAAKLHHTNIVPVFGVGEQDGLLYYAMQFIQGLGLNEILEELERMQSGKNSTSKEVVAADDGAANKQVESVPEPREANLQRASAEVLAHSLMSGEFQKTIIAENPEAFLKDDDNDWQPEVASTANYSLDESASAAEIESPPEIHASTATRHHTGSFSPSDSFVLPGQSEATTTGSKNSSKTTCWQSVARIGVQVADALQYAHDQGVLHRDIKPSNLLMDRHGTVWVTDFGLAKADDQQNITHTGDILGTLRYMAPEMFEGRSDARSEVYALGLTLYELLCLRPAFDAKNRRQLIKQVTTGTPAPLASRNPEIPRDLVTIVHKAIEKEADNRYQSAQELASDLERFIADEPIQARRTSLLEHFARWSRQNKPLAASLVAIASLVLFVAIGSTLAAGYFKTLAEDNEALAAAKEVERLAAIAAEKGRRNALANERRLRREADKTAIRELGLKTQALIAERKERRRYYASDSSNVSYASRTGDQHARLTGYLDRWANEEDDPRGWEYYFLLGQARLPSLEFDYTKKNATTWRTLLAVDWSPDGRRIVTVSNLNAEAFDALLGESLWVTRLPQQVTSVDWAANGRRIACGTTAGKIDLLDPETGRILHEFSAHSAVHGVSWSHNGNRLLSWGATEVKIWDTNTWALLQEFGGQTAQVVDVAWSRQCWRVAFCTADGNVEIWDTVEGELLQQWQPPVNGPINAWAWSPDSRYMAFASSAAAEIAIWDIREHKIVRRFRDRLFELGAYSKQGLNLKLAWSPDGTRLAATAGDTRFLWNIATGRLLDKVGQIPMTALAWSEDGKQLAAVGIRATVLIWPTERTARPRLIADAEHFDWGATGSYFVTGQGGEITVWDAYQWREVATLDKHQQGTVTAVCLSPDERWVAAADEGNNLSVWDRRSGKKIQQVARTGFPLVHLTFSPDGKWLSGLIQADHGETKIRVWNVENWQESASQRGLAPQATQQWSRDSRYLLTAKWVNKGTAYAGHYVVWDAQHRKWCPTDAMWWFRPASCWNRDGTNMVLATQGPCLDIRDVLQADDSDPQLGNVRKISAAHGRLIKTVDWSPVGQRLLSVGEERRARVWDIETLQQVHEIENAIDARWGPFGIRMAVLTPGGVEIHDASEGAARGYWKQLLPLLERQQELGRITAKDLRTMVELYTYHKQWEQALRAIDALQNQDPDDPRSQLCMADALRKYTSVLTEQNRHEEARQHRKRLLQLDFQLMTTYPSIPVFTERFQKLALAFSSPKWTVLKPVELKSENGTTLTLQEDGSILPSGKNPASETYTIIADIPSQDIKALRLEVLPHPSIQNGATGRSSSGYFTLTEVTGFRAVKDDPSTTEALEFTSAVASFERDHERPRIGVTIDGRRAEETHWNTYPHSRQAATVYYEIAPVVDGGNSRLTIHLEFGGTRWPQRNLGCFRLAVTEDPHAFERESMRIANPWAAVVAELRELGLDAEADEVQRQHARELGDTFFEHKDWVQAVAAYSQAMNPETRDPELFIKRARTYQQLGRWAEAAADWEQAIKLRPHDPHLLQSFQFLQAFHGPDESDKFVDMASLGAIYWRCGQADWAIPLLEEALRLMQAKLDADDLNRLTTMYCLAFAYRDANNLKRAVKLCEEILELNMTKRGPENLHTLFSMDNLAVLYGKAGELKRAASLLEQSLELRIAIQGPDDPDSLTTGASLLDIALQFRKKGWHDEALPLFERVYRLRKDSAEVEPELRIDAENHYGAALFQVGEFAKAEPRYLASYHEGLECEGIPVEWLTIYRQRLIDLYTNWGKPAEVKRWRVEAVRYLEEERLKEFQEEFGTGHPRLLTAMQDLVSAYQASGDMRRAVPLLAKLYAANPSDTLLMIKVTALQAWFEQDKEFTATIERALSFAEVNTDHATAERTAKVCCLRPSDDRAHYAAALKLARFAVEQDTTSAYYHMALGMAEYRNGNLEAAEQALLDAEEISLTVRGEARRIRIASTSAFYRAMSVFRQGRKDEALQLVISTAAKIRPLPQDENNPLADDANHDDVIVWLAYKEAKALVRLPETKPPAVAESPSRETP